MRKFILSLIIFSCFGLYSFSDANASISSQIKKSDGFFDKSMSAAKITKKGGEEDIAQRIGQVIKLILQFLGILILIMVIYAGIMWLTAGGNAEKAQKAQKILFNSFMGALIIGASYAITAVILLATQQ